MQYSDAIAADRGGRRRSADKETSDQVLVGLIAQGDKHAMQVLYGRHNVRVFRFLMRFVDGEATAEDLVSEVFFEVWRNAGQFAARSARCRPGCWRSPATRRCRRCGGVRPTSWTRTSSSSSRTRPTIRKSRCRRPSAAEILRDCLKQLSPAHREIIDLVYYHERTIEDVAEIIGVPQNTVKTRMFYARKRIGELLAARGLERAWV